MAMDIPTTFDQVITSLLETDLYKLTMLQPMLHVMPTNRAEYRFVCRNRSVFPLAELADAVQAQLDALCTLRHTDDELSYLATLRFLKSDFIEFLRLFRFQRRFIQVSTVGETLCVTASGPQVHVMGFEIPVLAIVNELYFRRMAAIHGVDALLDEARNACSPRLHCCARPPPTSTVCAIRLHFLILACGGASRLPGRTKWSPPWPPKCRSTSRERRMCIWRENIG